MTPRFWVFAAFFALVFLMGGGSRDDVMSLVILRPACAFFAAYALTVAAPGEIARVRVPLLLLLVLALWMVVQLIPLPPAMWGGLPGRGAILEIDKLVGLEGSWRPISLSPSKTMNALASLVVPISALLLYAIVPVEDRRRIPALLLLAAAASALLGLGQLATGSSSPLYLYHVTNENNPVGLFANRNHHAVFLATMFIIASYMLVEHRRLAFRSDGATKLVLIVGQVLLIAGVVLASQSRAGLLIGILAFGMGVALFLTGARGEREEDRHRKGWIRFWPIAAVLLITVAGLYLFSHSSSFDRLASNTAADDIRLKVFPQIAAMAQDNWLFGTGFGSFEHVYRAHEASEWLNQTYLNNAHDDWLQWVIEGGLPAILVFLGFCAWIVSMARTYWAQRSINPALTRLVAMALGVLLLLLIASALDYPLRVPSMMLYAILMVSIVADPAEPKLKASHRKSAHGKSSSRHGWETGRSERNGAVQ